MKRRIALLSALAAAAAVGAAWGLPLLSQDKVTGGGLLPTGRLAIPAGQTVEMYGRPVDLILNPAEDQLWVKFNNRVVLIDPVTMEVSGEAASPGGASLTGIENAADGKSVYFTNAGSDMHQFALDAEGKVEKLRSITLKGFDGKASFPCGLAINGSAAYVCLSRNNTIGVVDLNTGELKSEIPVGIAPFDIVFLPGNRAAVSCQGGPRATESDITAPSGGTETPVQRSGVAKSGSLSIIDLKAGTQIKQIAVGLQPSGIVALPDRGQFAVANSNSDTVHFINSTSLEIEQELVVKPSEDLPFGSMPNALALSPDGTTLYCANAGNNAIAEIDISAEPTIRGFVPTGWFPGGIAPGEKLMYVANIKGIGSREVRREEAKGLNTHDHRGSVQKVAYPSTRLLAKYTDQVNENARVPQILAAYERSTNTDAVPVPVPKKLGDPSVFKHVIYVIKENRTYDQFFGDIERGDGDPGLCIFPEKITPNHHALANDFVLLDNYYCNGVLSADGHSWATEGNVTPYLERAFGGFARSYTFGDDPITYSSTGFLWDHVLGAGLSFRNYGEFDYAEPREGWKVEDLWRAYGEGQKDIEFDQQIGISRLRRYSSRSFPGWNMGIPDILRMDRFIEEFEQFKQDGTLPNLIVMVLPQDHGAGTTPGYPTMSSYMADNDVAVGQLVEAVSNSQYWKDTLIIINEDDPQAGYDHVDGHRSICLPISAYTKRDALLSNFYNQSSVLHTICRIFGLPPLNQPTAAAPLMTECFTTTPDLTPFNALEPQVDLNAFNPPLSELSGEALKWAKISMTVPIHRTGIKTEQDEDNLNRAIWHAMKGYDVPYPVEFAGAHGKGLTKRRLLLDPDSDD